MIHDRDIWRAASLLLKQYGIDASNQAAQRADESLNHRNLEGYVVWRRVFAAVENLARTKPVEGEHVN